MSVSIVVVLHESAPELAVLLDSLDRFGPPGAQVVAVDTGSTDGGPALARARGAELVELPENPGFGPANNAGVARARHAVTVLLNPDCELLDRGLDALAAVAAAHGALVAPRLVGPDGCRQRTVHPLPGTAGMLIPALLHPPLLPPALRLRAEPWRAPRARTVGWAIAACLAAPTELLARLGPFDPDAFLFYEDLDLCLRARAAGVRTLFLPGVGVRHVGGHATRPAYRGEPHALLARRRHTVLVACRGRRAAALDHVAQALTFGTRWAARVGLRRPRERERAQLVAQLRRR